VKNSFSQNLEAGFGILLLIAGDLVTKNSSILSISFPSAVL